jgi:hypothetical protein
MFFLWDDWNRDHVEKHRVEPHEADYVVRNANRPYPESIGGGKWLVKGRTIAKRRLQVIFVVRKPEEIDLDLLDPIERIQLSEGEPAFYVIHARDVRRGER